MCTRRDLALVILLFSLHVVAASGQGRGATVDLLSQGKWESNITARQHGSGVTFTGDGLRCASVTLRNVDFSAYPQLIFHVASVTPGRKYSLAAETGEPRPRGNLYIEGHFPAMHRIPLAEAFIANRLDTLTLRLWFSGTPGSVAVSQLRLDGSPALADAEVSVGSEAKQQLWGFGGQADGELLELGSAWDGVTDADYCRVLDAAKEMGVTMVRTGIPWQEFTAQGGPRTRDVLKRVFRYMAERDIEPLVVPWGTPPGAQDKPPGSDEWVAGWAQSCVDYLVFLRDNLDAPIRFFELTNEPHDQPKLFTPDVLGAVAREFMARCHKARLVVCLVGPDNIELKWAIPWHEGLAKGADVIGAKGGIGMPYHIDWEAGVIGHAAAEIRALVGWDMPMFYAEFGTWAYTEGKPYTQPGVARYDSWESGIDMGALCTEYLNAGLSVILSWELYDIRRSLNDRPDHGAIAYKTEGWRKRPKYYVMKCVCGGVPRGAYVLPTVPTGGLRSVALSWPSGLHVGIINPYRFGKRIHLSLPPAEWDRTADVFTTRADAVSTQGTVAVAGNAAVIDVPACGGVGINLRRTNRDVEGRSIGPNLAYRARYSFDPPFGDTGATGETYPDTDGTELTDGAISRSFHDGKSVGWALGNASATIDTGRQAFVDKVVVSFGVGGMAGVRPPEVAGAEVSVDGRAWIPCREVQVPDEKLKENVVRECDLPVNVSARFVRVRMRNRQWTMLSEIQVLSRGQNIALHRPYTTEPGRAVYQEPLPAPMVLTDGLHASGIRPHPRTTAFLGQRPRAIVLDLGAPKTVQTVRVRFASVKERGLCLPRSAKVSSSLDGVKWLHGGELVPPATAGGGWVAIERCFDPVQTRYVRIETMGEGVAVDEAEAYGSSADRTR